MALIPLKCTLVVKARVSGGKESINDYANGIEGGPRLVEMKKESNNEMKKWRVGYVTNLLFDELAILARQTSFTLVECHALIMLSRAVSRERAAPEDMHSQPLLFSALALALRGEMEESNEESTISITLRCFWENGIVSLF